MFEPNNQQLGAFLIALGTMMQLNETESDEGPCVNAKPKDKEKFLNLVCQHGVDRADAERMYHDTWAPDDNQPGYDL